MDWFNRCLFFSFCFKFSFVFSVFRFRFWNWFRVFVIAVFSTIFFICFNIFCFIFIICFIVFRCFFSCFYDFRFTFFCLNWSNRFYWFNKICRCFCFCCIFFNLCWLWNTFLLNWFFQYAFCNDFIHAVFTINVSSNFHTALWTNRFSTNRTICCCFSIWVIMTFHINTSFN